jgi:hypothetical protein
MSRVGSFPGMTMGSVHFNNQGTGGVLKCIPGQPYGPQKAPPSNQVKERHCRVSPAQMNLNRKTKSFRQRAYKFSIGIHGDRKWMQSSVAHKTVHKTTSQTFVARHAGVQTEMVCGPKLMVFNVASRDYRIRRSVYSMPALCR